MPLIQSASEEALQKNIATEIEHGKDPKQAAAIGYATQRANDAIPEYEMGKLDTLPSQVSQAELEANSHCYGDE
jgi:hypothetical protein